MNNDDNINITNSVENAIEYVKNSKNKYNTRSQRNEIIVMNSMMNDKNYNVGIYNTGGYVDSYFPGVSFRNMVYGIIKDVTQIPGHELTKLLNDYEFNDKQAKDMVNFSKEFLNTYILKTGRKLNLGGRENSNVLLNPKIVKEKDISYPYKIGQTQDGKGIFETRTVHREGYLSMSINKSRPKW